MNRLILSLLLSLVWLPCAVQAENMKQANGYQVHYNAFKADFITPEVARQYGLVRSNYRALLNVAVIREEPGTTGVPVAAQVVVKAADLMQKLKNIELQEIREGDAIYYIGDFPVIDREIVNFKLRVTPEGTSSAILVDFSQQFYVD